MSFLTCSYNSFVNVGKKCYSKTESINTPKVSLHSLSYSKLRLTLRIYFIYSDIYIHIYKYSCSKLI